MLKNLVIILMASVLVNNYVLSRFLGVCPFLGVSKKLDQAAGMGAAVIFVMLVATAATWPIYTYLLSPKYEYLQTIVFILVIAALVQFVEIVLKKYIPALHKSLGIYLPLITTNCAVLGVALLNTQNGYNFIGSVVYGFTGGIGFLLAIVLFASIRERLDLTSECPKAFEGFPIALVTAGLIALAFMGFSGLSLPL